MELLLLLEMEEEMEEEEVVVLVEEMVVKMEGEGGGEVAGQGKAMAANSSLLATKGRRREIIKEREGVGYL